MSDIPADWRGQLDLRAEIARIDRDRADTEKLRAERRKFDREPYILAIAAMLGALATLFANLPNIIRAVAGT